ncbi:MAG: hypothetical protein WCP06_06815 [Verrucomicrobiota bacterium]
MKILIPAVVAVALLAGCAEDECEPDVTHAFIYRGRYDQTPYVTIRGPEQVDVTTARAYMARREMLRRSRELSAFEAPYYRTTATRTLEPSGTTVFESTPGAGAVQTSTTTEVAPPVAEYMQGPKRLPGASTTIVPAKPTLPFAKPVPGRPGYVLSPYAPNSGYVDVSGLAPGSDAKDPYTGRIFRVP